jgi:hypothetical protein
MLGHDTILEAGPDVSLCPSLNQTTGEFLVLVSAKAAQDLCITLPRDAAAEVTQWI